MQCTYSFFIETKEFWFTLLGVILVVGFVSGRGMKDDKGKPISEIAMIQPSQLWEIISAEGYMKSFLIFLSVTAYVALLCASILGIIFH